MSRAVTDNLRFPALARRRDRYVLITPCRDEARYARTTLQSVAAQTLLPALWVVVDDGSTDATPKILADFERRLPFLRIVRLADRGERKLGGGVIDAFYAGLKTIDLSQYDYLCKLDLDLDLPKRYFETLVEKMETDPRLGTCSGKPWFFGGAAGGRRISEKCGSENSVGMSKFYRRECFEQIGGFVREVMWDGIDCHRCRMLGWKAASWDGPDLSFQHLRPMGTSHHSWWTGRVRHGRGQYFMGTSPVYMAASALFRTTRPPVVLGGAAMLWGYVRSALGKEQQYGDPEFRRFLRGYQLRCLMRGKRKATIHLNESTLSRWRPARSTPRPPVEQPIAPNKAA
jgi:biofilm PGA synthesis N-glycosyltransferase PgaC